MSEVDRILVRVALSLRRRDGGRARRRSHPGCVDNPSSARAPESRGGDRGRSGRFAAASGRSRTSGSVAEPDANPSHRGGAAGSWRSTGCSITSPPRCRHGRPARAESANSWPTQVMRARTPLAAIRGYTELAQRRRDGCRRCRPCDESVESRPNATHLVEDLLLLARLDSGRPSVEPVDLARLSADVVSDAHTAGPDHRWNLGSPLNRLYVAGTTPACAGGGQSSRELAYPRHRNVGNAVAAGCGDTAVLRVTDDGPGIPAELQSEVFERFARATHHAREGTARPGWGSPSCPRWCGRTAAASNCTACRKGQSSRSVCRGRTDGSQLSHSDDPFPGSPAREHRDMITDVPRRPPSQCRPDRRDSGASPCWMSSSRSQRGPALATSVHRLRLTICAQVPLGLPDHHRRQRQRRPRHSRGRRQLADRLPESKSSGWNSRSWPSAAFGLVCLQCGRSGVHGRRPFDGPCGVGPRSPLVSGHSDVSIGTRLGQGSR